MLTRSFGQRAVKSRRYDHHTLKGASGRSYLPAGNVVRRRVGVNRPGAYRRQGEVRLTGRRDVETRVTCAPKRKRHFRRPTAFIRVGHSSGLVSTFDFATSDWPHVFALRETEVAGPPDRHFSYSNDGYKTLGLVLRAITKRSYGDVIRSRILEPLGMHATDPTITNETRKRLAVGHEPFYDDRPARRSDPLVRANWFESDTAGGCLASTAGDLAIYLRMLLNRGQGSLGPILSEQSFARMSSRVIEDGSGGWYGYGLATFEDDGHTIIGHGGGMPGFVSAMTADMEAGVGAVILANAAVDLGPIANFARKLLRAALTGASIPDAPIIHSDPTFVEDAGKYEGTYGNENTSFKLVTKDKRLVIAWKTERLILERREMDAFLVPHGDFALFLLRFERQNGQVVAATFG